MAWLPDRTIEVARDSNIWSRERLTQLGSSEFHLRFWDLLDRLADVFWPAARRGLKMPMRTRGDLYQNWRALDIISLPLTRYLGCSMGDVLDHFALSDDLPLVGLLSMMIEDTVHAQVRTAPLINSALGISIRGAGLARPVGGMRGFWRTLAARYVELGGTIKLRTPVRNIDGTLGSFSIFTDRKKYATAQVVCALSIQVTRQLAPSCVGRDLLETNRIVRFL